MAPTSDVNSLANEQVQQRGSATTERRRKCSRDAMRTGGRHKDTATGNDDVNPVVHKDGHGIGVANYGALVIIIICDKIKVTLS